MEGATPTPIPNALEWSTGIATALPCMSQNATSDADRRMLQGCECTDRACQPNDVGKRGINFLTGSGNVERNEEESLFDAEKTGSATSRRVAKLRE